MKEVEPAKCAGSIVLFYHVTIINPDSPNEHGIVPLLQLSQGLCLEELNSQLTVASSACNKLSVRVVVRHRFQQLVSEVRWKVFVV